MRFYDDTKTISERLSQKVEIFRQICETARGLSTCKRVSQSALIFTLDFSQILAFGYNGVAAGLDNDGCKDEKGKCGCVHAELNACLKLASKQPCILMCTQSPCIVCARAILNCKQIKGILYIDPYRDHEGLNLLMESDRPVLSIGVDRHYADFWQRCSASPIG